MVSAPSPRGRGLQGKTRVTGASSLLQSFSAIAPGKGTASVGLVRLGVSCGRFSAIAPGRGTARLSSNAVGRRIKRFSAIAPGKGTARNARGVLALRRARVSAPSPRGRGLQVTVRERFLPVITEFQRHRPGEGDCKIR